VSYVNKITILSEEKERITESMSHDPPTEHQFGAIPDMDGLLGVDLRHQFSAEAKHEDEIDHVAHPHIIMDIITTDFHVSV